MQLVSHNIDYDHFHVHMWYISKGKCLYVDRLLYIVFLGAKMVQKMAKKPPRTPGIGAVLVLVFTHTPHENLALSPP